MLPIPNFVELPGEYLIEVVTLHGKKEDEELGEGVLSDWDGSSIIQLRASRENDLRRADFIHEMQHAIVDWADWWLGKSDKQRKKV